jgi:hypothetical protein
MQVGFVGLGRLRAEAGVDLFSKEERFFFF